MQEYHMDCPRAVERLLRLGVPATVINPIQVGTYYIPIHICMCAFFERQNGP